MPYGVLTNIYILRDYCHVVATSGNAYAKQSINRDSHPITLLTESAKDYIPFSGFSYEPIASEASKKSEVTCLARINL